MTCPRFPKCVYRDRRYSVTDRKGTGFVQARELFGLTEGKRSSSKGADCVTTYVVVDNKLVIESVLYDYGGESKTPPAISVKGREISAIPRYCEREMFGPRTFFLPKKEQYLYGWEYLGIHYPIAFTGKLLLSFWNTQKRMIPVHCCPFGNL